MASVTRRVSPQAFLRMKASGDRIAVLTGYDASDARLLDGAGIDVILVGDSIGNVRLGYPDTTYVTMKDMLKAVKSVASTKPKALVVADMPIHSFDNNRLAIASANSFIHAGADAVKLEGGVGAAPAIRAVVASSVPVMGHIGLTPQTDRKPIVEGRDDAEAIGLLADAKALEDAGAFSMVVELTDAQVGRRITESVSVPTIGIGAGPHMDGQVLVLDDLLGWTDFSRFPSGRPPRFLGDFWDRTDPDATVRQYIRKVRDGTYPSDSESYHVYEKR
jgi:3-methyl-2-oxobutanoate hydroxymethyltransferase